MTTKLCRKIQTMLLIGSVLTLAACATANTGKTIANKTDETMHITIEKEKFETPPNRLQPVATQQVREPVKTVAEAAPETTQSAKATTSRINSKDTFVNVRTAPSVKSRNIAVLRGGQAIEILEVRDVWMKVKWLNGDVVKLGWLKKRFVEGYE